MDIIIGKNKNFKSVTDLIKLEKLKKAKENDSFCKILNYHAEEEYKHIFKILEIDEEKGIIKLWCEEYNEVEWSLENISDVILVE
uniref:Uncharacterized protein n=1 Tax=Myoviridae sp. ctEBR14 TaxID=2825060 RepID=A0A8S5NWU4_9CAUD|nr:MAG TPA: hypothetical protein [Myoviridae sp. ctEBR14]